MLGFCKLVESFRRSWCGLVSASEYLHSNCLVDIAYFSGLRRGDAQCCVIKSLRVMLFVIPTISLFHSRAMSNTKP